MPTCPCCGDPNGQFVMTIISEVAADQCEQTDTYRCTACGTDWPVEHAPPPELYEHSDSDFELIGADY